MRDESLYLYSLYRSLSNFKCLGDGLAFAFHRVQRPLPGRRAAILVHAMRSSKSISPLLLALGLPLPSAAAAAAAAAEVVVVVVVVVVTAAAEEEIDLPAARSWSSSSSLSLAKALTFRRARRPGRPWEGW